VLATLVFAGVLGDVAELLGDVPQGAVDFVLHNGPAGAVVALYAEESGVPVFLPGDVFIAYLGNRVSTPLGWLIAWLVLVSAVILGATNLYWISRRWGRRVVEARVGRWMNLTPASLEGAERWFARYGVWALIFGRHIPGLRVPITVAAGTLRVGYGVFIVSVAISTAVWAGTFLLVGMRFGHQFEAFLVTHRPVATAVPALVLVLVVVWRFRHRLRPRVKR
jgi:membrane protein DedA with SNARE-associated domain